MGEPLYPALYQINTRVWLTERSRALGRPATLDDIPDAELDRLAQMGFDWVWLLSVWRTGAAGQRASRANPEWRHEFEATLPDLREEDIAGSGFAITGYTVHPSLGGDVALARLRERLRQRGLRLMLDFVPNHTAMDHPWVEDHPEYFVPGTEVDLARAPQNYTWVQRTQGHRLLAHGRDPYFDGWPDTLQLDYSNAATQEAMLGELLKISGQCDGVRCDMAMLVLPDVFERTWGRRAPPFWPKATQRVRERVPGLLLHGRGLLGPRVDDARSRGSTTPTTSASTTASARATRGRSASTCTPGSTTRRSSPGSWRTTTSPGPPRPSRPACTRPPPSSRTCHPGLRFFHQGQFEGRRKRISPHLVRAPVEPVDEPLGRFYERSWRCSGSRPFATASGACSSARRPGRATGRGTASSPSAGRGRTASDCSSP